MHGSDTLGCRFGCFMFPAAKHGPSGAGKRRIDASVPFDILLQLALPEVAIQAWVCAMYGAAMPKASINEHREKAAGERHIDSHAQLIEIDPVVLPKAESHTMQRRSQCTLRSGIGAPIGSH
ncbi:MAG TPA: hypothetical protein VNV42_05375 [Solirubrobacteraceae bacterium]|jgi:hypothetical protein|nr:hypothetical protein [Solirubrobacteraceae bacterium]